MQTKFLTTLVLISMVVVGVDAQTAASYDYYNVNAGAGNGIRFWNNDYYKVHMGNTDEYHYGPVKSYSIKMNMYNDENRGWTWGVNGEVPVAALNTGGTMQLAEDMHIMGNVGIGTNTPFQKLHLFDPSTTATPGIRFNIQRKYINSIYFHHFDMVMTSSDNTNGVLEFRYGRSSEANTNPASWETVMKLYSSGYLRVNGFSSIKDNSYYVYPASTNISMNLAGSINVAGSIQACGKIEALEIEVKSVCATDINVKMDNLADYVFSDNYKLMNLTELEDFIKENNHLPEMPSAETAKEEGVELVEMNNLLLKKIEELTLYILEQDKRIKNLETVNSSHHE